MDRKKIINWCYYTITLLLVGMVALSFYKGFEFLLTYYGVFIGLFIVWMILLFVKMNEDRKRRKRKFDPFRNRDKNK